MTPVSADSGGVTACVIARDAAPHLAILLPTLRWADEVLVLLDDRTIDDSRVIAGPLVDRLATVPFESFPAMRNRALAFASRPWVFFVDADERVSDSLAAAVRAATTSNTDHVGPEMDQVVGHWIPRQNVMFGRVVRGGGWWPDYQLRLLRRGRVAYDPARIVHELVTLDGSSSYLAEPLLHLNYESIPQFIRKQRTYTALEANMLRTEGVRFRPRALFGQPLREFWRRFVTLRGWTDGPVGLFLSLAMAYYAYRRVALTRQRPVPTPAVAKPPGP